ncbi:phbA [Symbiodinium microadriaticum]|nr:phbA [Symbiodinium microadriaticum]
MPADVRSFSAGSTASGHTTITGRSNLTGFEDSKSLKGARSVAEDVLTATLRREFEALRGSAAGRSPSFTRLPGRRLGKMVSTTMREAAFAVGMSPARQPPGTSPVPSEVIANVCDGEGNASWLGHGSEAPETSQEVPVDSWDRLQAVESEVTRLGEELRRVEEEQQHAARQRGDLQQADKLLMARLSTLEGDKAHTGVQVQNLHALISALDRGARGLSEDLTCVVEEVELRLAKIGQELSSQRCALQQMTSSAQASPSLPVSAAVQRLCSSNPRMQRSEATRLCQSLRAWRAAVCSSERPRLAASDAAAMPMIEQHLQQRFEWLEQRALLSARCEVLRQREELCLAVGTELHEANHAHFQIDEAKVLKLSEGLSEVQQRVEDVEASLPQLVTKVSELGHSRPAWADKAFGQAPESLNAVRADVGAVACSVAQLDEVFREALELNDLRDSKVEELRQALSEVAETSVPSPEDAVARQAVQVVWQSVEELQEALRKDPSKADVAKDLRTLRDDLELLKEQAPDQRRLSRTVEELQKECHGTSEAEAGLRKALGRIAGLEEEVKQFIASQRKSTEASTDVNDLRHSLAELQEAFRKAEQKAAAEAHCHLQELSEAVTDLKVAEQESTKASTDVNDLRHSLAELSEAYRDTELSASVCPSADPSRSEEMPEDLQIRSSLEGASEAPALPAPAIYQGKPRDVRPRPHANSGTQDGSPKCEPGASGSTAGETLSTNPAMASSFDCVGDTLAVPSETEEHSDAMSVLQDELKLLAFEAQRQRRQSIKMHAELGQALASLEEQRLQHGHAEEELWAHLQVQERRQRDMQGEVQSAFAELAALQPGSQPSVEVQFLEQVGSASEELQKGFAELRMSFGEVLEADQRPAQQIQSEQLAQTEASLVALRGTLSLELGEVRHMLSEEMASQARDFSEQLAQGRSSAVAEIETVRAQLIETVEDSIEVRRQLLELCRSHTQPRAEGEPITASSFYLVPEAQQHLPWTEATEWEAAHLKTLWSRCEGLAEEVRRVADRQTAAEQSASRGLATMQQAVEGLSIRLGEMFVLRDSTNLGQR